MASGALAIKELKKNTLHLEVAILGSQACRYSQGECKICRCSMRESDSPDFRMSSTHSVGLTGLCQFQMGVFG